MESAGIVERVTDLFDKHQVIAECLCCDDDSSLRADCSWSNADHLKNNNTTLLPMVKKMVGIDKGKRHPGPDKGKLLGWVPQPTFVADPNDRRKTLTGELIQLDTAKVTFKFTMTRMDRTSLAKNFGHMARGLRNLPQSEWSTVAGTVLEHHIDVHDHCNSDWCSKNLKLLGLVQLQVQVHKQILA
jgi:hypothetical protein